MNPLDGGNSALISDVYPDTRPWPLAASVGINTYGECRKYYRVKLTGFGMEITYTNGGKVKHDLW